MTTAPMKKLFQIAGFAALITHAGPSPAATVLVDFESFQIGDGLSTVNAFTVPLGATFIPVYPNQFSVITDPNNNSNKILSAATSPQNADILVNFSAPVDFVRIQFINNPETSLATVQIIAYDQNNTSTLLPLNGSQTIMSGTEPTILASLAPGTRSIQIESASGFAMIDNFEFQPVPVPAAFWLFGSGLLGMYGLIRRRRSGDLPNRHQNPI